MKAYTAFSSGKDSHASLLWAQEVFDYVQRFASQKELFKDENKSRSCMSFYGICE